MKTHDKGEKWIYFSDLSVGTILVPSIEDKHTTANIINFSKRYHNHNISLYEICYKVFQQFKKKNTHSKWQSWKILQIKQVYMIWYFCWAFNLVKGYFSNYYFRINIGWLNEILLYLINCWFQTQKLTPVTREESMCGPAGGLFGQNQKHF